MAQAYQRAGFPGSKPRNQGQFLEKAKTEVANCHTEALSSSLNKANLVKYAQYKIHILNDKDTRELSQKFMNY